MDMLIKKYGETNKGKKRLCLITNAQCPIKDPYEGTKEDQVTIIADQMTARGMRMESIAVRGRIGAEANQRVMEENDRLLNIFSKRTRAKLVHVESPISLFGALKTRNISAVTIFRGELEVSPKMKIKVRVLLSVRSIMKCVVDMFVYVPSCMVVFPSYMQTLIYFFFLFGGGKIKITS